MRYLSPRKEEVMKNIVYIKREQLLEALRKHDELLKDNPIWKEEMARFKELNMQEKLRRDKALAQERALGQPGSREKK